MNVFSKLFSVAVGVAGIMSGYAAALNLAVEPAKEAARLDIAVSIIDAMHLAGVHVSATPAQIAASDDPAALVGEAVAQSFASVADEGQVFEPSVVYTHHPSGWPMLASDGRMPTEIRFTLNGDDIYLELAKPYILPAPYSNCSLTLLNKEADGFTFLSARILQRCVSS